MVWDGSGVLPSLRFGTCSGSNSCSEYTSSRSGFCAIRSGVDPKAISSDVGSPDNLASECVRKSAISWAFWQTDGFNVDSRARLRAAKSRVDTRLRFSCTGN